MPLDVVKWTQIGKLTTLLVNIEVHAKKSTLNVSIHPKLTLELFKCTHGSYILHKATSRNYKDVPIHVHNGSCWLKVSVLAFDCSVTDDELKQLLGEVVESIIEEFLQPTHYGLIPRPT